MINIFCVCLTVQLSSVTKERLAVVGSYESRLQIDCKDKLLDDCYKLPRIIMHTALGKVLNVSEIQG